MYDSRLNLTNQVVGEIKKYFADKVFRSTVPRSVRISEAPSYGEPICYYDKANRGTLAYQRVAEELLERNREVKMFHVKQFCFPFKPWCRGRVVNCFWVG